MLHSNSTTSDVSDQSGSSSGWAIQTVLAQPDEGLDWSEMSLVVLAYTLPSLGKTYCIGACPQTPLVLHAYACIHSRHPCSPILLLRACCSLQAHFPSELMSLSFVVDSPNTRSGWWRRALVTHNHKCWEGHSLFYLVSELVLFRTLHTSLSLHFPCQSSPCPLSTTRLC